MSTETPTQGMIAIDDDLTNTKTVLWEMIAAHQASPSKSRERSLLITKLQEARMWADEAQALDRVKAPSAITLLIVAARLLA